MEYNILSNQIDPFVRHAERRNIEAIPFINVSYAKDWRLFSLSKGNCTIVCGEEVYRLKTGDSVLIPPMFPYEVKNQGETYLYIINFDMLSFNKELFTPIPILRQISSEDKPHQTVVFKDMPQFNFPVLLHAPQVLEYLKHMCETVKKSGIYSQIILNADLSLALTECFGQYLDTKIKSNISDIIEFIGLHYAEHITNASIAQRFHYHPNYVNRLFVTHTGQSLHQYVMKHRIKVATELLLNTNLAISEIAEQTGWHSPSHFSRGFKQITGFAPNAFRKD